MRANSAYKNAQRATYDPMQIEYDLLLRAARDLETASGDSLKRVRALMQNAKLWQAFAFDLAEPGNTLADPLKAQIISLSVWVVGHTQKAIGHEATVDALVEVNRTIARGLLTAIERRQAEGSATAAQAAATASYITGA